MSQITSGIRSMLSHPAVYDVLQNILGAKRTRRDLVDTFVKPSAQSRILDIGCGTAEILAYLPETISYWGYDISNEYIDAAKSRFGKRGHFFCGELDRHALSYLPKFDVILAIGVLHHLDDNVAEQLFSLIGDALQDGGRLITIDPCFAEGQNPLAKYLIRRDRGQNVRDMNGYHSLANKNFRQVHGTLRHRNWIPYTHWIMECSK